MVFCSIVLKVKRIHKIVISSCFAANKITNWSWHRCCATESRGVSAFLFSRSVSLKTKFYSILSALTSHHKGLPLKWFRNSWFLAPVRFSIQRDFAPSVPVPASAERLAVGPPVLSGLLVASHRSIVLILLSTWTIRSSPRGSTYHNHYQENNTTAWHFAHFLVSFYCVTVQPGSMAEDHSQTQSASRLEEKRAGYFSKI